MQASKVLAGPPIAERIRAQVAERVAARLERGGTVPGLATVLVGEDPASQVYVRNKRKTTQEAGMQSFAFEMPASVDEGELIALIEDLNVREDVHGILVQLPLPKHLNEVRVLNAISPIKDVDGLHPENVGLLAQKGRQPRFIPATPKGIMYFLEEAGAELSGADAVVLGRSNIVGMPIALLLLRANATVTIGHSRTRDLPALCRRADVLIAAVGIPEMVRGDWVKPGAVVIDVGVNRIEDASRKSGFRLVGDVAYDEVSQVAAAITPVPGGVGPMTIAMLLENTLQAAELAASNS
jgi:5,10-methylene-tetrahydrofolate dehydrogenase/methenyl tetrahydrofolate cyclohydrolase